MAKRPTTTTDGPRLFEQQETTIQRRLRRQRLLFLPRLVREAGANAALSGPARDRAYQIVLRWADRESSGQLALDKETSIDTQFLDQVFAEGLGYQLKTQSPGDFQLEHKFAVAGAGIADAALGHFPADETPTVVIELKDAATDLDRDRSNGRTAVQQCFDYLTALPSCPWGIVSNFRTIRLYNVARGRLVYEEFSLQELREPERFNEFYAIFQRGGLLTSTLGQPPRALGLLQRTQARQKEVGDELYRSYHAQRLRLIDHLLKYEEKNLDRAIAIAQKILDRVIFIAFCEDRGLLPEKCLDRAYASVPAFSRVKNPRWHNFLGLFGAVDKGSDGLPPIDRFNGGLFADDPEIDALELDDEPWTTGFRGFGHYDFSEEVSVEVLGHLFERSITELEKLRVGGWPAMRTGLSETAPPPPAKRSSAKHLSAGPARAGAQKTFDPQSDDESASKMLKSAQRKRFGIYYTPPAFTGLIVERTVDALVRDRFAALAARHGVDPEARQEQNKRTLLAYWNACHEALKNVTVCDPACGSGAFLIRAYDALDAHYKAVIHGLAGAGEDPLRVRELEDAIPEEILGHNLYGVDLSREGVEITQLALWIRSARKGKTLADLSGHIVHGNSLVADTSVDPKALDWQKVFPRIFGKDAPGGFSCVIGNPPWERVKVQDREFFSLTDPQTAEAVSAAQRKQRIAAMPTENPQLHASYEAARQRAQAMLDYARKSERYPLTGKGDVNLYMLFAELARTIVAPEGIVGLLVPSGIATDDTTKEFFADLMERKALVSLYDFENKQGHFEDVHRSFKFTALIFTGAGRATEQADFVFFAHGVEEVAQSNTQRHIPLSSADMKLLNPNTRTCPIFRTRRDAALTKAIYKRVPILIDENRRQGGNPWGIKFLRMFDQTNDAGHFAEGKVWEKKGYALSGNVYIKGKKRALPLYEAKMVQAYDHRAASVIVEDENWVRQGQKVETSLVQHQNPEFAVLPRWWVEAATVDETMNDWKRGWFLAYKDITSATNERTMIAAFMPRVAVVNSAPLVLVGDDISPMRETCLLANLNAIIFDFVARQKVGAVHLNFFIVEQLPTLTPDVYADPCPWSKQETLEAWVGQRVLKLSCTAEDMIPLAQACNFKGSRGDGVHAWKEAERSTLRAELDAAYFILYGLDRDDAEYVLSTFSGTGFIAPKDRDAEGHAWERGGIGEAVLAAYDHLKNLAAKR